MLRRLLELEVPEIYNGTVEVKAVAREAGYRSKVAVAALQDGVDPVGSCVGMRGVRIQSIVNELNGEKIDVVAWSSDPATFIANSLSPAKVLNVMLEDDNDDKTAVVVVPDRQLSLAIGKEGQNARLAAKLTNWRIDIKSISEAASEALAKIAEYKDVQAAVAREQNLITMAREILEEKEGTALSDGEMQVLSQVVRIVYEAEKSLEKEHAALRLREAVIRALEEEEPSETSPRLEHPEDLLARAEAILAAKSAEAGEEQPQEAEASVSEGAEASEAALPETVPFPLWEEEAAVVMGETAETSPQMETAPQEISLEKEQGNLQAAEEFYVWEDEEEEGEELPGQARKKKQRGKRHELIYDEKLGAYVPRRQRKPGRQRGGWEDYL
jgi:N utilization substance protein A